MASSCSFWTTQLFFQLSRPCLNSTTQNFTVAIDSAEAPCTESISFLICLGTLPSKNISIYSNVTKMLTSVSSNDCQVTAACPKWLKFCSKDSHLHSLTFIDECCHFHVEVGKFTDHPRILFPVPFPIFEASLELQIK